MPEYTFTVNGKSRTVETDESRPLLDVLREDLEFTGAKFGCGEGQCRACTVLVDGRPVTSCMTPVRRANGKTVVTIEGLAVDGSLHPVQQAFLDENAMQCGYCIPGMIVRTVALLDEKPSPSREEIVTALDGNICRCCGYARILAAVERAATLMQQQGQSAAAVVEPMEVRDGR
jgi:aerobic-type carbon monoxide dehydrogenase small subunit (CoxS/CutS family)